MKAFLCALVFSLALHFFLFYEIKIDENKKTQNTDNKTIQKGSSVKFVKLQKKPETKKTKKIKEIKKQEFPKEFKKVPTIKPQEKRAKTKDLKKLSKDSKIAKPIVEAFNINDFLNAKDQKEGKDKKDDMDGITKSYIKLYGEEFTRYSDKTKKYLKNSIATIGQITQRYLEYPHLAIYGKQSGRNVIRFFLHPDGSISDIKITSSSGYNILDWNTKDTIELAYKDYPRPEEKTKIIIYVNYILN